MRNGSRYRAVACAVLALAAAIAPLTFAPGAARGAEILVVDGGLADGSGGVVRVDPVTGEQNLFSTGENFSLPAAIELAPDGTLIVADQGPEDGPPILVRVDPITGGQTLIATGVTDLAGSAFVVPQASRWITPATSSSPTPSAMARRGA